LQISIFMSPINVHVTLPNKWIVKFSKYHPGKFLVAWHPKLVKKTREQLL
jgi:phosphatidylserine decarboxylase